MADRAADVARLRGALATNPADRVSWHNLAAAEGDLGRAAESEAAARRAIELGIAAPETRLVHARALQGLARFDEAERAFEEAIRLRPAYADAQRDLAQLRWMRTGDVAAALARLDATVRASPREGALHLVRSTVIEFAGDAAGALAAADAGLKSCPGDAALLRQASHLAAVTGDAARGLALARSAASRDPGPASDATLCEALLAGGQAKEADAVAARLLAARPTDQHALALQSIAWRLLGDERHRALHDYDRMVATRKLDVPRGFATLEAFLAELAAELGRLHGFVQHPLNQSVRGGSQLHLQARELSHPLIAALFGSIALAVQRYLEGLGPGSDPLRARNTGRFGITGAWSVRLKAGGHHVDHVHPHGWLSSACYIAVPPGVARGDADRSGWLRLGRPGVPTVPALPAEHYVRPEPGVLALFPAYMWHGVEPFAGGSHRLSVAFDVVPR